MSVFNIIADAFIYVIQKRKKYVRSVIGVIISIASVMVIQCLNLSLVDSIFTTSFFLNGGDELCISLDSNGNAVCMDNEIPSEILDDIERKYGGVKRINNQNVGEGYLQFGKKQSPVCLISATDGFFYAESESIVSGRGIDSNDMEVMSSSAVISDYTAEQCFGSDSPIGKQIMVHTVETGFIEVTVIGVYHDTVVSDRAIEDMSEYKAEVFVTETYLTNRMRIDSGNASEVAYFVDAATDKESLAVYVRQKLKSFYRDSSIVPEIRYMSEQLSGFKNASGVFVKVIGIFALLAFIIGSVGVMNMTLIYVGERTNEIGIRKAIGAEEGKIGFQFLSEVVIVSFAGTLIGIIAGIFIGVVMFFMLTKGSPDIFGGARLIIPWEAALSTALLSLLLSLVAGIFPAVKAIRMTITDALRK